MPGLKVFIKGLDKVVDFPTDTSMEVIEQSIKGGWNEIEKISGLPMDTASRMDRARYLGFDPDNVLTHGSPNKELNEIKREGLFDGVFASPGDASEYGGEFQHSFIPRSGKVADEGDVDFDYDQTIKTLKKEFPGESDDYYDELYEATANDKFDPWDDNILEKQGFDDAGEASWEAQRIRGKIAEDQGFDAVAMDDEFGVSYLLPAGTKARKLGATFDPTKKASSNLLASAAGATVGLGALAQSDESVASQSADRLLQEGLLGQQSKAFNIPFPLLNKAGLKLQEFPQSLIAGGIGRGLETLSTGRENELTDEEIRSRAIGVGLDFL